MRKSFPRKLMIEYKRRLVNKVDKQQEMPDLDKIKGEEGQGIDLAKYDKEKALIDTVIVKQVKSEYTEELEDGTKPLQWVLQVSTEVLETLGSGDDAIDFRASELFNLMQDKEGTLTGFPIGEKSNLGKFMRGLKITGFEEISLTQLIKVIKGKQVLIKAYEKMKGDQKRTYLKFLY